MDALQKTSTKRVKHFPAITTVKLKRPTKQKIVAALLRVNAKPFGRKVTMDEILNMMLSALNEQHIKTLQDSTLCNTDRVEMAFKEYVAKHPGISKDTFMGMLLSGGTQKLEIIGVQG